MKAVQHLMMVFRLQVVNLVSSGVQTIVIWRGYYSLRVHHWSMWNRANFMAFSRMLDGIKRMWRKTFHRGNPLNDSVRCAASRRV